MAACNGSFIKQAMTFFGADIARRCTGNGSGIVLLCQGIHIDAAEGIRTAIDGFTD